MSNEQMNERSTGMAAVRTRPPEEPAVGRGLSRRAMLGLLSGGVVLGAGGATAVASVAAAADRGQAGDSAGDSAGRGPAGARRSGGVDEP